MYYIQFENLMKMVADGEITIAEAEATAIEILESWKSSPKIKIENQNWNWKSKLKWRLKNG